NSSHIIFFFQAEDGIRDKLVTGVQTCALPISCYPMSLHGANEARRPRAAQRERSSRPKNGSVAQRSASTRTKASRTMPPVILERSEERRVGKECRSRWARERETKRGSEGVGSG